MNPEMIIEQLGLQKHPEGGWFSEIYRSNEIIQKASLPARYSDDHCFSTSIYFLLKSGEISMFHRLKSDEIWHFYSGDPLRLILLYPDGSSKDVIMGNEPLKGQHVQFVIPAGVWQAGHMIDGGRYSLYGCTMSPGFTADMFEGGTREHLMSLYPERADDIIWLSCSENETQMPHGFAE